jgi:DNA primase
MEYLLVHRGGRGQSFEYELLYEGQGKEGRPFCPGLIDVDSLASTSTSREEAGEFPGPFRGQNAPLPGAFRGNEVAALPAPEAAFLPLVAARFDEALPGGEKKVSSYPEAAKEKSYRPRRYFLRGA